MVFSNRSCVRLKLHLGLNGQFAAPGAMRAAFIPGCKCNTIRNKTFGHVATAVRLVRLQGTSMPHFILALLLEL